MAEYIDRSKIFPNGVFLVNENNPMTSLDELINRISTLPTANVVEVVRCKDCNACEVIYPRKEIGKEAESFYFCNVLESTTKPTHFCSYGVKRSDNNGL